MKKILAVMLCVVMLIPQLAITSLSANEPTLESFEIGDVELVEDVDGMKDYYYDDFSNEYEYFYYYWEYAVETVILHYSDGTTEEWHLFFLDYEAEAPEQDYFNQWQVGDEYEITVTIEGIQSSFKVTIVENPIASIQVVETVPLIADLDGYVDIDFDENWNEYEFFRYDLYLALKSVQVIYTDGTIEELPEEELWWAEIYDDQGCFNQWHVGTHTATLEYYGRSCEFEVEIIPNTIVSIEVEETLTYTEYVDGAYTYDYDESFNEVSYFEYNELGAIISLKINHEDGTFESVDPMSLGNITVESDQSYNNQWTAGSHKVTVSYGGASCEFDLYIEPNGVESVEVVESIALQENTDGLYAIGMDQYGIEREYFAYDAEKALVKYIITYEDGEVIERYHNEMVENFPNIYFIETDQSYINQWKVGNAYKAQFCIYGKNCEFEVSIEEPCDYRYFVIDGEVYISGWSEKGFENRKQDITIPEDIFGYPVVGVEFLESKTIKIETITVPDSVYYIGANAFNDIETLERVVIGKNVANLSPDAFVGLEKLEAIEVHEDNADYVSVDGVVFNKKMTELVAYPEAKGSEYVLPSTITSLYATYIYESVDFIIPEDSVAFTVVDEIVFSKDMKTLVRFRDDYSGYYMIPENIEVIDFYAFYNCTELYQVFIPESVLEIREGAFSMCTSLTAVLLPSKLEYLGAAAFAGCENLNGVIIQENLQFMGEIPFFGVAEEFVVHYTGTQSQWDEFEFSFLDELFFGMYTVKCYGRTSEVPHVLNGRIVTNNGGSSIMEQLQPIKLDEETGVYMGIDGWIIKSAVEDRWQDSYRFLYGPTVPTVMLTVYYTLGDADEDGLVAASDITEVIKSMKTGYEKYSDTDYDGVVSATDITNVIKLMKGSYVYVDQPQ